MLQEIEILQAASSSKYLLNDVFAGQNDPMYRLLPSVSDLNSNCQLPRPNDRRNFDTEQWKESLVWTPTVNCPGRATEETSTPNKTCRRGKDDERRTGMNATNWMGRLWNFKIKVIPISILTLDVYLHWLWNDFSLSFVAPPNTFSLSIFYFRPDHPTVTCSLVSSLEIMDILMKLFTLLI